MNKVVILDLGDTLESDGLLQPHAAESVAAIARLQTTEGTPVRYCLVSDFHLAVPFEPHAVAALFSQYLDILDQLGLRDLFTPEDQLITLSTHANVMKPDRHVFELALERLGSDAAFEDCLFVTENTDHIAAAKLLGLNCLQFGLAGPEGFENWAEGMIKVAVMVDPASATNAAVALELFGGVEGLADIQGVTVDGDHVSAAAQALVALDDQGLGDLSGLHVQLPAKITLERNQVKPKMHVEVADDVKEEAKAYVRSLQTHGKLSGTPPLLGQPTHEVATDEAGRKILRRRGFD